MHLINNCLAFTQGESDVCSRARNYGRGNNNMKRILTIACAIVCTAVLFSGTAFAQGSSGATLQASKTIDICLQDPRPPAVWRYSGEVSVWNDGATATQGLQIYDCVQNKVKGPAFTNVYCGFLTQGGAVTIPGFSSESDATVFTYSFTATSLAGTIRNDALVQITNHSGRPPGQLYGPEPKATYTGTIPPTVCRTAIGPCSFSQGHWAKPGVVWPSPYDRLAPFYISNQTWNDVANSTGGYYILAVQHIGALLNAANGADAPSGVQDILNQADAWFTSNPPQRMRHGSHLRSAEDLGRCSGELQPWDLSGWSGALHRITQYKC